MAEDREARRQARLRGAQRHQIADVDFGLSFPSSNPTASQPTASQPTASQPISSQPIASQPITSQPANRDKTPPVADLEPQLPARKTPEIGDELRSPTRSKRKTPHGSPTLEAETASAKRIRLEDQAPSSGNRSQSRRDLYSFEFEEPDQAHLQESTASDVDEEAIEDADFVPGIPIVLESQDEVIEESPPERPGSGRRRRSLRNEPSPPARNSQPSSKPAQQPRAEAAEARVEIVLGRKSTPRVSQSTPKPRQDDLDELDELSPEQFSPSLPQPQAQFSDDEDEEAEEINDLEAAKYMEKQQRREVPDEDSLEPDELDGSENATGISGISGTPASKSGDRVEPAKKAGRTKNSAKASPAVQRPPKTKGRKSKADKKSRGEPIPVTIYRLTKAPNYDEDADEADILISNVPYFKRAGANAVDVLSQVAEEIIETALSTFQDAVSNANDAQSKKDLRVKLRALTQYQQEMRPRLLEMSSSLDHGYSLSRRIRVAQKQRVELREDVMRIRSEREKIALRMDEIRMKQEANNKHFLERNEINNAFHDIENAVERGKAMPDDDEMSDEMDTAGLEMLLKSVAAEVSGVSDEGGVLRQVKEFNAFLERTALALEGRV